MSRVLQFFTFCRRCGEYPAKRKEIESFGGTDNRDAIRNEILSGADRVGIEYVDHCPRCAMPRDEIHGVLASYKEKIKKAEPC